MYEFGAISAPNVVAPGARLVVSDTLCGRGAFGDFSVNRIGAAYGQADRGISASQGGGLVAGSPQVEIVSPTRGRMFGNMNVFTLGGETGVRCEAVDDRVEIQGISSDDRVG